MAVRGLLPLVLLALLRGAGSAAAPPLRQVRWWSSHIDETVDMVYAHRRSVTGIYPCCGGPGTAANGSFEWDGTCDSDGRATGTSSWVEAMAPLGLTVENAAYVNGESLVSGAADDAIPAFVRCAVGLNLTGYMFDTESLGPMGSHVGGSDKQQAVLYSRWLGKLSAAMRKAGKTVGVTLSDWGLLYEYSLYAKAEVDHIMTMATYCKIVILSRFCHAVRLANPKSVTISVFTLGPRLRALYARGQRSAARHVLVYRRRRFRAERVRRGLHQTGSGARGIVRPV